MGFDLHATKRGVEDFHLGAFSWPVLLEACGYLFPCVNGQGQYCCPVDDKKWIQIGTNDGFKIGPTDAKLMARVARNFVKIQRTLPPDDRDNKWPMRIRTDFVDRFDAFADWAEKSGGFKIW
jgi:hypothetical protein